MKNIIFKFKTASKLNIQKKYLKAHMKVMRTNGEFEDCKTIYIDATAGFREPYSDEQGRHSIDENRKDFFKETVKRALELKPQFDNYIFIDNNEERYFELAKMTRKYPGKCQVFNNNADEVLKCVCDVFDWETHRAIVFLDPFAMNVKWQTIQNIAKTRAIDLWYMFPLGSGVIKLLKANKNIGDSNKMRLDEIFGGNDWISKFHRKLFQSGVFREVTDSNSPIRHREIMEYIIEKLKSEFVSVIENPKILHSESRNPLYLLCFAAGDEDDASEAIDVADSLIKAL